MAANPEINVTAADETSASSSGASEASGSSDNSVTQATSSVSMGTSAEDLPLQSSDAKETTMSEDQAEKNSLPEQETEEKVGEVSEGEAKQKEKEALDSKDKNAEEIVIPEEVQEAFQEHYRTFGKKVMLAVLGKSPEMAIRYVDFKKENEPLEERIEEFEDLPLGFAAYFNLVNER